MKRNLKKQLETQQAAKTPTFKVNMKAVNKMADSVIDALKHAHEGVLAVIKTWKGERPETLDKLKEQVKERCKAWLKDEKRNILPQSVYNHQSEIIGCINGFIAYAGMTPKKAKEFDKAFAKISGYHQMVKFLRDTKRGKKITRPEKTEVERNRSAWKNHKREAMTKAKNMLRAAPTESLLSLQDFIDDLIEARKKGNVDRTLAGRQLARKVAVGSK